MKLLIDLMGILGLRSSALRSLAARQNVPGSLIIFFAGFLTFVFVRNTVYARLKEPSIMMAPGLFGSLLDLNVVQALLFISVVYVPAIICLGNAFAGDGLGLSLSRTEYRSHMAVLPALWGILLLLAAPLQAFAPQFIVLGVFGISIGLFILVLLLAIYTVWAIREINYISLVAASGVFVLSWVTLPLFYLLTAFLPSIPLIILIPVMILFYQRARDFFAGRGNEREFQEHLRGLAINPQDADAQHQLGLIHFKRGDFLSARTYFEAAMQIDPSDPDYHYYLGRTFEGIGEWAKALEQYEETYRLDTGYGLGDIFREVGKGYLNTGRIQKAIEFLQYFLQNRGSDPEGRYWLAVALQKSGDNEGMRMQLRTILDQARENPRFFRKGNRQWIFRARALLRG